MLGRANTNWHVENTWGWMDRIPKKSFWARFRAWAWEQGNLREEEFAHLYAGIGRPSVSPAQLAGPILIQRVGIQRFPQGRKASFHALLVPAPSG